MLKTRVITAVILVLFFLWALFWFSAGWWALLTLAAIVVAGHEWSRLWSFHPAEEFAYLLSMVGCGILVLFFLPPRVAALPAYLAAALFWFIAAPIWMAAGWKPVTKPVAALAGAVILLPAWLALNELRALNEVWLLAAMALVWVADIAAYFAGRAFGRHKLAPAISPGKTWEGVVGGVVGVLIFVSVIVSWMESHFADVVGRDPELWPTALTVAIVLCGMSVLGDLFESAVKRRAGVKDSGAILPGHGGLLDRIDALLPVLPLAALVSGAFARSQYV